ncbi:MAG TPA: WecB/TagA/CpsF family glycosyltransferase [Spirochaetia bacterium]|nr:WecB/TagA/CpsF family glycosyltransferase [Spirochaetia bacterium]
MDIGAEKVKRIKVLDVPVDAIDPDVAGKAIEELLEDSQANQIVFLSLRGLLRARHDPELMRCLRDAALILPTSLAVVQGASVLGTGKLSLFNPFEFIIRILSVIEKCKGSVYLFGARKSLLETAEVNLLGSFHGIRVVGRFYGFFSRGIEADIVTAIKKSSPSLLLVGTGVPGKERWLLRHKREFNPGISLWADNCFEVFAGTERQVSRRLHAAGLGILSGIGRKPWRLAVIFPYLWYLILLLVYKIFKL